MPLRHGVQYASTANKKCPMYDPRCAETVIAHVASFYSPGFDAAALVEKECGRFVRGKHAGQLRGWATIEVVTEGGWKRGGMLMDHGRVVRPGQVLAVTVSDFTGRILMEVR